MNEPAAAISRGEVRFEFWRHRTGFFLAPLVFLALWFLPVSGLSEAAHRLFAIFGLVITLWVPRPSRSR